MRCNFIAHSFSLSLSLSVSSTKTQQPFEHIRDSRDGNQRCEMYNADKNLYRLIEKRSEKEKKKKKGYRAISLLQ